MRLLNLYITLSSLKVPYYAVGGTECFLLEKKIQPKYTRSHVIETKHNKYRNQHYNRSENCVIFDLKMCFLLYQTHAVISQWSLFYA
uniref:Uncharacterized protein n=1 Tax=Periophthalmus magnuspinnatus TaxID=409849 RepID=A0A3B4BGC9_9GOBI